MKEGWEIQSDLWKFDGKKWTLITIESKESPEVRPFLCSSYSHSGQNQQKTTLRYTIQITTKCMFSEEKLMESIL